jgi:hypothetical protein
MQQPADEIANVPAAPAQAAATPQPSPAARRCENCGSTLYGEHCFACGQPTKGLVRHFSSVLGDFFDTVFNIDSRVLRTLGPLLVRPAFLSLEYFAGRRVRYVTPMRLFLFLSLVAFFAVQGSIDFDEGDGKGGVRIGADQGDSIDGASTPAQVREAGAMVLAELDQARKEAQGVPGATVGIDIAREQIQDKMRERIERLAELEAAKKAGKAPPAEELDEGRNNVNFPGHGGKRWNAKSNPYRFGWLPAAANDSLNRRVGHAVDVLKTSKSGKPLVDAMFRVLPQTLLVMMPIFALMLKLMYLFKRRLYMEHLIVALHSHSFIALAVILIMAMSWLLGLVQTNSLWANLLNWARGLAIAWIPLYLLLMQKRVYGQGWPMTLAKYSVLGVCYSVLLFFAMLAAVMIGLLTL